jgi:hypothetical protein
VAWFLSSDVHALLDVAGDFLRSRPVDHTLLLTEAAYVAAHPGTASDQLYGWWRPKGGEVAAAFLRAPRHSPALSMMPAEALWSLVERLPELPPFGVDSRLLESATRAWREHAGANLVERSRIRLYRLNELRAPILSSGRPRTATDADRELLVSWYQQLMEAHPGDASELSYVVDDPLSYGGITLWEVDGSAVAMAGRSRLVAGMVRLGAVHSPRDGDYGDAAFVAACAAATQVARDVLVFASATDTEADMAYRRLGFEPVLDRVTLGP